MGTKLESKLAITLDKSNPEITQIRRVLLMGKSFTLHQFHIGNTKQGFPIFGNK